MKVGEECRHRLGLNQISTDTMLRHIRFIQFYLLIIQSLHLKLSITKQTFSPFLTDFETFSTSMLINGISH